MPIIAKPYKRIAFVSNSAWSIYNFRLDVITHLVGQGYEVLVLAPMMNTPFYYRNMVAALFMFLSTIAAKTHCRILRFTAS